MPIDFWQGHCRIRQNVIKLITSVNQACNKVILNWIISNDRIVATVSGIWVELISLKSGNFVLKISFMENYSWEWSLFHHWVLICYEYRCQKFAWLSLTFSESLTKTDKNRDIHYQYTTGLWKIMWKWASLMVYGYPCRYACKWLK